ncbi:hypothetical protein P7K49_032557 [Saguinus oedipus]|uniref:Uncharacterized protein n=1 Tax=Saguinus oedipus TaxID=9490 RepID=A0ABQ9TYL9_SAGOE|nr:hypothetical protein P7K49_032557 [Saguinus oedipus]
MEQKVGARVEIQGVESGEGLLPSGNGTEGCSGAALATALEGLKVVEIEKCKSDIKKMREELAARSSR